MLCVNIQGQRGRDVIYVANSNVWCVGFQHFSVLSSEVVHVYAYKTLMCLLMAEAIGPMQSAGPRAVSQASRHVSLSFKPPRSLWFHF